MRFFAYYLFCMLLQHITFGANVTVKAPSPQNGTINREVPKSNGTNPRSLEAIPQGKIHHVVSQGDTLSSISRQYGITINHIMLMNALDDSSKIRIGQKLFIPQMNVNGEQTTDVTIAKVEPQPSLPQPIPSKEVSSSNASTVQTVVSPIPEDGMHIVEPGETLFAISRKYRVHPIELATENNVDLQYMVRAGQKIKIPVPNLSQEKTAVASNTKNTTIETKPIKVEKADCKEANFSWPLYSTKVTHKYLETLPNGTKLDGIIVASEEKKSVVAAQSGEVAYVGNDIAEYGNLMIIKHKDNWMTIYGYLDSFKKKVGQKVSKGDTVAIVGQTGDALRPSLYFSIRNIKVPYNPELCI